MCKHKKNKKNKVILYDPTDRNVKLVIKFTAGILTFNKVTKSKTTQEFNPLNTNQSA